jgi:hypothetical protein
MAKRKMAKPKKKDLKEAKARGLITKEQLDKYSPTHVCVACGRTFQVDAGEIRNLGCSCCSLEMLTLDDAGQLDRDMHLKMRVAILNVAPQQLGVITKVDRRDPSKAFIRLDATGETIEVYGTCNVEKIHHLKIEHCLGCSHASHSILPNGQKRTLPQALQDLNKKRALARKSTAKEGKKKRRNEDADD